MKSKMGLSFYPKWIWIGVFVFTTICLSTQYWVWIPDILTKSETIVGTFTSQDGDRFLVTQQWNGRDFYSTFLKHHDKRGNSTVYVLDGDDIKRWRCAFDNRENSDQIKIMFGDEVVGVFKLRENIFLNHNGDTTGAY